MRAQKKAENSQEPENLRSRMTKNTMGFVGPVSSNRAGPGYVAFRQLFFEVVTKKGWKLCTTALLEHFGHSTFFFPWALMDIVTLNFLLHFPQM